MTTKKKLLEIEKLLEAGKRYTPFESGWNKTFPNHGGVYVLWKGKIPIYVGETSSIRSRMADLMRPVNHAFTKKTGISSKVTCIVELRKYITENYKLSFVEIDFGRSEVEEYLILRWRNTLINKPAKRLLIGPQYSWVKPT